MLGLKEDIYNLLSGDSTITGYVGTNIYPSGVDAIEAYPAITIELIASKTSTFPTKGRVATIRVSVWSSASELEVENIYSRVWTLMNYMQNNTPLSQKVYWSLEDAAVDNIDTARRVWSKHASYKVWIIG